MSVGFVKVAVVAGAAVAFVGMGGCANTKANAERASLLKQNQDLASQLEQERAARAAAEARANTPPTPASGPTDLSQGSGAPGMENPELQPPVQTGEANLGGGITTGRNEHGEETIRVSSDVLFDSGKASLKPAAKTALDKVAGILKKSYAGQELRIEGYTDPNPVKHSGWEDNWDLGAARAHAVMLFLQGKGVRNMYIASFGATKLKSTKNLAADRRVEIVVVRNGR
ncbi:MAG TPA: OmpA family protein [Phycisphaerae bacterium]|nr:OmpA family protein [Phycisphaerae bacterium]